MRARSRTSGDGNVLNLDLISVNTCYSVQWFCKITLEELEKGA